MTRRLRVRDLPTEGGRVELDDAAAHHLRVLRLEHGHAVTLFDGHGGHAAGTVSLGPDGAAFVDAGPRSETQADPETHLILVMPKASALEDALRMATELGVTHVHLAHGDHSVARIADDKREKKLARLERLVSEAARQCERDRVPILLGPTPVGPCLANAVGERFVCWARGPKGAAAPACGGAVSILIGPEGGLSEREVESAFDHGFGVLDLGPHVLRVPTAVAAALARIR